MTSTAVLQPEPSPIVACTVSRDVQNFDMLIEDMEALLGETWGDLSFEDASLFLSQPDAQALKFLVVALDDRDEPDLPIISDFIKLAVEKKIQILIVAEEVSPVALHALLKLGAEEFIPYPMPEGALADAVERMQRPKPSAEARAVDSDTTPSLKATGDRDAVVVPVHGLAGGTGATTFAINMAWELANMEKENGPRVCLLDFDLQFGSCATYLDLPRREAIYELLSDTGSMDNDSFMQALLTFNERLHVLTAPSEMLPLDFVGPEDIERILKAARTNFDYVVIDLPTTVVHWSETVLHAAHVYFALIELDMRSAQNTLRLMRALKADELPHEKLRFVLNRAPRFTDLSGRSRVKRMADSLDIKLEVQLPDGGKQVLQSCDHGMPLAEVATKNPLRKEITKLAKSMHDLNLSVETG